MLGLASLLLLTSGCNPPPQLIDPGECPFVSLSTSRPQALSCIAGVYEMDGYTYVERRDCVAKHSLGKRIATEDGVSAPRFVTARKIDGVPVPDAIAVGPVRATVDDPKGKRRGTGCRWRFAVSGGINGEDADRIIRRAGKGKADQLSDLAGWRPRTQTTIGPDPSPASASS